MSELIQKLKTQIEYYLSDANLEKDHFFNDLLNKSDDRSVGVDVLLNCNNIKKLTTDKSKIIDAIRSSDVLKLSSDSTKFSRLNTNIPELKLLNRKREEDKNGNKSSEPTEKDEVVIYSLKASKVSEIKWKNIQDEIIKKNPNIIVSYLRFSSDSGHIGILKSNTVHLTTLTIQVEDVDFTITKAEGDELIDFWKCHGQHLKMCLNKTDRIKATKQKEEIRAQRENAGPKGSKYKLTKPIQLGNTKFLDVKDIRQKSRTILNNITPGEHPLPNDNKFLLDIIAYHPNKSKAVDLDYFTTGQNPEYDDSKCFVIVKKDGSKEDFSINKCIKSIEETYGSASK